MSITVHIHGPCALRALGANVWQTIYLFSLPVPQEGRGQLLSRHCITIAPILLTDASETHVSKSDTRGIKHNRPPL